MTAKVNGSVLVVGAGIAGMQSALDLADSGFYVHLVEKSPAIGGVMAQLDISTSNFIPVQTLKALTERMGTFK